MHQTYTAALSKGEFDSGMSQKSQSVNKGRIFQKSIYMGHILWSKQILIKKPAKDYAIITFASSTDNKNIITAKWW